MQDSALNSRERNIARPRILLTDSNRWPAGARLAIAFQKTGCEVGVLCRTPGHPAQKVSSIVRVFDYRGYAPIDSLTTAIREFDPDLIVPCCDRSVQHLHELHLILESKHGADGKIVELIERSLGSPKGFSVTSSRFELLQLAQSEGILVPKFSIIRNESELQKWSAQSALPWVMKADVTSGGQGIQFVKNADEAREFILSYSRPPGTASVIKRLLLNRDWAWIIFESRHSRRPVIAQSVINGRPANCAVVCWQGEILAGVSVEVIKSKGTTGPATLVQIVEGAEMISAAEKIARRLGITGFFGLDFVIEEGTGAAYLIEMNPRCTPPCPLELRAGRNLVAALCSQLTGQPLQENGSAIDRCLIAYFPQVVENGGTLDGTDRDEPVHLDIPLGEPDLIHELLYPRSERTIAGQLVDRVRRRQQPDIDPITVFKDLGTYSKESALKH